MVSRVTIALATAVLFLLYVVSAAPTSGEDDQETENGNGNDDPPRRDVLKVLKEVCESTPDLDEDEQSICEMGQSLLVVRKLQEKTEQERVQD